ncbi:MAG: DNA/RNA helicase domain-containing protein [Planctomycetota bacterium]|nr:DNA/RNA helicase domain-containing protein [Planctomycetota bacterium]
MVCLIGGGQEIYQGEGGMEEWIRALINLFPDWKIYASPEVDEKNYVPKTIFESLGNRVVRNKKLHLKTSVRSFRSERLSDAVEFLLAGDIARGKELFDNLSEKYPIALSRSLPKAKKWVKDHARGSERYGILASSGAKRLRPEGITVDKKADVCHWFLSERNDVRSSFYMEDVATEFDVQGLELDWAVVAWDINLRRNADLQIWDYKRFRGTKWEQIKKEEDRRFLMNSYRVLLTRARQGFVIFVPFGSDTDITRLPQEYDSVYSYLVRFGFEEL